MTTPAENSLVMKWTESRWNWSHNSDDFGKYPNSLPPSMTETSVQDMEPGMVRIANDKVMFGITPQNEYNAIEIGLSQGNTMTFEIFNAIEYINTSDFGTGCPPSKNGHVYEYTNNGIVGVWVDKGLSESTKVLKGLGTLMLGFKGC